MTLTEHFHAALAASEVDLPGPELLPERLARACAQVLPVDGAGISLLFAADRRLPLGASDPVAAEAERLQFTAGEGPCLTSHAEQEAVLADEATMEFQWPGYHDALVTHTPIRGTVCLPISDGLEGIGALDLYVIPPNDIDTLSLRDAAAIADQIAAALHAQGQQLAHRLQGPAWLDAPAAARRSQVWQAIGMVNVALHLPSPDALTVLRAHAYAHNSTLDDLAAQLVNHQIPVTTLSLDADRPA